MGLKEILRSLFEVRLSHGPSAKLGFAISLKSATKGPCGPQKRRKQVGKGPWLGILKLRGAWWVINMGRSVTIRRSRHSAGEPPPPQISICDCWINLGDRGKKRPLRPKPIIFNDF